MIGRKKRIASKLHLGNAVSILASEVPNESRNEWKLLAAWSRLVGGDPRPHHNQLQLLKQIAIARGHSATAGWNETGGLRAIASTYGKNAGGLNDLQALRAIAQALNGVPANRTIGNMNEIDCLRAIVRHHATVVPPIPPFDPATVAGLELWLDGATVPLGDGTWSDTSGEDNHAVQANAARRPTHVTNDLFLHYSFDGTDDVLTAPVTLGAARTFFMVVRKRTAAGGSASFANMSSAATSLAISNTTNGEEFAYYNDVPAGGFVPYGGTVTDWSVITVRFAALDSAEAWVNGVSGATFNPNDDYNAFSALSLGALPDTTFPADVDIAEVLFYDAALSVSDREYIEAGLIAKYFISVVFLVTQAGEFFVTQAGEFLIA